MRYGVTGTESAIARKFMELCGTEAVGGLLATMPLDLDRYLICTGYLAGKQLGEMSPEELEGTWLRNFVEPAEFCDRVFAANPAARVCLIGSESGFAGSHDMAYAGAKAALHLYVQTKRLERSMQMLVAIAPHIIWDTGMTQRREDLATLAQLGAKQRIGRWLEAGEVALQARTLLAGSPALSGTIVRMRAS